MAIKRQTYSEETLQEAVRLCKRRREKTQEIGKNGRKKGEGETNEDEKRKEAIEKRRRRDLKNKKAK